MGTPFLGADFRVQSAAQRGLTGIRVRYTHDPLAASSTGPNDALNIAQYSLTGPATNYVVNAAIVPDDPQAIDLALAAPLVIGLWTLTVSTDVQTATARPLQIPYSATFTVSTVTDTEGVDGGATNDSAESTIRKHLPSSLAGKAWNALIAALAVGDRLNWDNAKLAFDQLFKSTASGLYLDRKASDDGLARPPSIGMPDDLFRKLAIKTTAAKLTHEVLLEIMEVFYGSDAVRASASTDLVQPFSLTDGYTLELLMDERDAVSVIFKEDDFARITQATAEEVAVAITQDLRKNRNKGFAIAYPDPVTNLLKVRVYSGSLGLSSSVRITGGTGQLALQFPSKLTTYSGSIALVDAYTWAVTSPAAGTNRLTLNRVAAGNKVDLSNVQIGDYVVLQAPNSTIDYGVYPILDVGVSFSGANLVQFFDIGASEPDHAFVQQANQELTFFRPQRLTLHSNKQAVIIAQTVPGVLDVRIPATTQAVGRNIKSASYLHDSEHLEISSFQRLGTTVTVGTVDPHLLETGDYVSVEECYGSASAPSKTIGNPTSTGNPATSDASLATIWTQTRAQDAQGMKKHRAIRLVDGRVLITGGYFTSAGTDIALSSCQLFNITSVATLFGGAKQYTYRWDTSAFLPAPRNRHGGTLLTDTANADKVFVTGGFNGSAFLETTALYTPNVGTGSWLAGTSMANKRMVHGQVTLQDSRVLVTGGAKNDCVAIPDCELYDPTPATWAAAGSLLAPRADHRTILLNDGKVLVIGGRPLALPHVDDNAILAHWKIDEAGGTTAVDTQGNYNLTAVAGPTILDGKIDKARDFSVATSHLTGAGNVAASTALKADWTFSAWFKGGTGVLGSFGLQHNPMLQVETVSGNKIKWLWGPSSLPITFTTNAIANWSSFWNHVAVVKRFYAAASLSPEMPADGYTMALWRFNEANGSNNLTDVVGTHTLTQSGSPLPVAGVVDGGRSFDSGATQFFSGIATTGGEQTTFKTGDYSVEFWGKLPTSGFPIGGRTFYDILYVGGLYASAVQLNNVLFGLNVQSDGKLGIYWDKGGPGVQIDTLLPANTWVVADGWVHWAITKTTNGDGTCILRVYKNAVLIYTSGNVNEPDGGTTGTWNVGRADNSPNKFFGTLDEMRVSSKARTPAEIAESYERGLGDKYAVDVYLNGTLAQTFSGVSNAPGSINSGGTWYIARSVNGASTYGGVIDDVCVSKIARTAPEIAYTYRRGIGAVGTNELILPAATGELHSSCEVYDPNTNTWTATGGMAFARINHTATLLGDGRVLVAGGTGYVNGGGAAATTLSSAEVYDPTTGRWQSVCKMGSARTGHGAVRISDRNKVLVAGGGTQSPEYFDEATFTWKYTPNAPTNTEELLSQSLTLVGSDGAALLHGGHRVDTTNIPAYLYQPGEDVFANGGLNGVFRVNSVASASTFTYATPNYPGLTTNQNASLIVRKMAAEPAGNVPGPFVFDPLEGAAITGTETEATMDLFEGQQYKVLEVADATNFPDAPGWLVIGFGRDTEVVPVRYLGKLSPTALILDYSFKFPQNNLSESFTVNSAIRASNITTLTLNLGPGITDHGIVVGQSIYFKSGDVSFPYGYKTVTSRTGTTIAFTDPGLNTVTPSPGSVQTRGPVVTLLKQKGLYVPPNPEDVGAAYITASSAGRTAALTALNESVAAGIDTEIEVVYPSDRGLGGEGLPVTGQVLSDKVAVWGGDNLNEELETAREDS